MIVNQLERISSQPLFFCMSDFIDNSSVYLKLEGLNIAGSIKLKTAKYLLDDLEERSLLVKGRSKLIESSSGNLAIALALLCKARGYGFTAVIDPNILPEKEQLLYMYGAEVIKVTDKDPSGGYLATRIKVIEKLLESNEDYIWCNQYKNIANQEAHYELTAREIFSEFDRVDYLFIGAGTTGTLMGCAQYFKEFSPDTRVVAVDAVGSVSFDKPGAKRLIPGIGTSRKPELLNTSLVDDVLWIEERETINSCQQILKKYGLLVGGSTGSVLAATSHYFRENKLNKGAVIVVISPDFGQAYMNSIFNDDWVVNNFGSKSK